MIDEITLTLNNPLTDEQWDAITDVDFDRTDRIWLSTKHGKEVEFAKVVRCKDCIHRYSTCPMITIHPTGSITFRAQDDWFCFMGERKEE